jgi:hypothetical protein
MIEIYVLHFGDIIFSYDSMKVFNVSRVEVGWLDIQSFVYFSIVF